MAAAALLRRRGGGGGVRGGEGVQCGGGDEPGVPERAGAGGGDGCGGGGEGEPRSQSRLTGDSGSVFIFRRRLYFRGPVCDPSISQSYFNETK